MKICISVILCLLTVLIGYLVLLTVSAALVDPGREYTQNSRYYRRLLNSATVLAVKLLRIRVHALGLEKLPDTRFLLISNHRSNFDPILTWYLLPQKELAFISKEENFHIPVFGRLIRKCCFLSIDRKNAREARKTVEKAAQLLRNGATSVGVYPEGTRSKRGVLLPFHDGVFKIAQLAGVPIVVMTVEGTEKIHRNTPLRKTDVYIKILSVLPSDEIVPARTREIGCRIRKEMEAQLTTKSSSERRMSE